MSNIQKETLSPKFYPKKAHFESKSQVAPNSLIFNRSLSEPAKIFLLALNGIISCTQNWIPIQSDIQKRLGWSRSKIDGAIDCCSENGFLKVKQKRGIGGKFEPNDFEFCLEGSFKNCVDSDLEENDPTHGFQPLTGLRTSVKRTSEKEHIPIPYPVPNIDIYKGNAPTPKEKSKRGLERAVPLFHPKKEMGLSKQRKFPRKPEHQACFEWLMSLKLTDENGFVDEDNMSYLSHKHPRRKLENAYSHLLHKVGIGKFKPRSLIASFTHVLNNEHSPVGLNSQANRQYALDYKEIVGWRSLEIYEKYVEDLNFPGQDISLNMNPEEFQRTLDKLFDSIQRR